MKTAILFSLSFLVLAHVAPAQAIQKAVIQNTYSTDFKFMTSADLNNDGVDDFIGADGTITWYEGAGESTFGTQHVIETDFTGNINQCKVIDMNNDGWADLFYLTADANVLMGWFENPGTATDSWVVHQMPGLYSNLIGLFDFDSDGDMDLIYEDNLTYLGWRENTDNSFILSHSLPDTYSDLTFSATSDFDQDGDVDWVGYFYDCCTKYFSNNGNGTFSVTTPSSSECVKPVIVSDINHDGYTDIVYFYSTFQTSIFSPVTNTFGTPGTIGDIDDYISMEATDIDGDHDEDWIIKTEDTYGGDDYYRYHCARNNGFGFDPDSAIVILPDVIESSDFYSLMDLNDDGYKELFISGDNGGVEFYPNNGSTFEMPVEIELENYPKISDLICFDIDGDPDNDLLLATGTGALYWYEYNHVLDSFTVTHSILSLEDYPSPTNIKKKDIDGDGDFDLVVSFQEVDGYPEVTYYCLNDGNGNFTNHLLDDQSFDNLWFFDADADGDMDMVAMESDTYGNLMAYSNTGDTSALFTYVSNLTPSGTWYSYVSFDIDNDGDDDMVGAKSSTTWLQKIMNVDGVGGFGPVTNFINCACSPVYSVFAADFDNDTDVDIIYTCSSGNTYLATNTAGTYTSASIGTFDATLLSDGSHTGVFDLNADGYKDIHYNKVSGGSGYKLATGPGTFDDSYDFFSEDYGRFGYVDDGGVVDFIGSNNHELYIQYNIVMLAPSYSVTYPSKTWLEENGESDGITFTFDQIPENELMVSITPSGSIDAGTGEGQTVEIHIMADSTALIPKTISWQVPDDAVVEDVTGATVQVQADAASWGMYAGLLNQTYTYTVADNDLGLFMSGNELTLTEGLVADTIYAHFNVVPDQDILLQIAPDVLVDFGFDAAITETVTLAAGFGGLNHFKLTATPPSEDFYFEPGASTVVNLEIISDETMFDDFIPDPINVYINDNDVASIETVFPTASVSEGLELFETSISLTSSPYNIVTVTAYPNLQLDLGNGPGTAVSVVFEADGTLPAVQTITGIAFDDYLIEGGHTGYITFSIFTDDPDYSAFTIPDLIINIDDNDAPQGINIVTPAPDMYVEGTSGLELNLSLFTNPNELVTIYATPDTQLDLGAGTGIAVPVVFDLFSDATEPHIINITITDDYIVEGDHTGTITFDIVTIDPLLSGYTIDALVIQITDDDELQGVNINYPAIDPSVEGTTGLELNLSLWTDPNELVTIYATPDMQLDLGAGAGIAVPVEFETTDDATEPHLVNVNIVDDYMIEGDHSGTITFSIITADPVFDGYTIETAVIYITDNDELQGVNILYPGVDFYTEGTSGLELNVSLFTNPNEVVTIYATPDMQLDLGAGAGIAVPVIFDLLTDATDPHLVNMMVADDYIVEGNHTGTITFSIETADPVFDGYTIADAMIYISDNDEVQGVNVTYPSSDAQPEGTTGLTIDLSLFTSPNNTVTIYALTDMQIDMGSGAGMGVYFVFEPGEEATLPQILNYSIVDDELVEGDHSAVIYFEIITDDPQFGGYSIPAAIVNITDNDEETSVGNAIQNGFMVYPTCGNGLFTVHTEQITGDVRLTVANMAGQTVYESILSQQENNLLDLTEVAQGNYILVLSNESSSASVPVQIIK